jgi:peptidoglycan/LPS O-acetylase OafA/YrhL
VNQTKKLSYIRSFDGIRAFFCLSIMVAHWKLAFPIIPIGWECLQIFFVLSGFLITRILLHERDRVTGFGRYIKVFYYKRAFRIFPLYFAYILFWQLMRWTMQSSQFIQTQTRELEQSGVWLYTYLYNFKSWFNFKAGTAFDDTPIFSHLWSLSVEEQFYLFFPFVIFFLRGRILKAAVILLIVLPQVTRYLGYPWLLGVNDDSTWAILLVYRNIIFQYDSLAMGAALAVFNFDWLRRPKMWFWITVAVIAAIDIYNFPLVRDSMVYAGTVPFDLFLEGEKINWMGYIHLLGHPEVLQVGHQYMYMMPLVNIACFFMVLAAIRDNPVGRRFFEHRFMVYLGKISYGMYVYHYASILLFTKLARALIPESILLGHYGLQVILFLVFAAIVIFVSHLSFRYFESIFLRLKNKIRG